MGGEGLACDAAALGRPAHRRVIPRGMAELGVFPWGLGRRACAHGHRRHRTPLTKQVGRLILNAPLLPSTTQVERPTDNTLRLVLFSSEVQGALTLTLTLALTLALTLTLTLTLTLALALTLTRTR